MFHISAKSDYAIAFLMHLAKESEHFISVKKFCEQEYLPEAYLAQIVPRLKAAEIIESKEGKNGGHRLLRKMDSISVLEVLEAVEGKISLVRCLSETENLRKLPCTKNCKTKKAWEWMANDLRDYFSKITLETLKNKMN